MCRNYDKSFVNIVEYLGVLQLVIKIVLCKNLCGQIFDTWILLNSDLSQEIYADVNIQRWITDA